MTKLTRPNQSIVMKPLDPASLRAHHERVERDGYTIVEGVFADAFADAVLADLDRLERELGEGPGKNLFEGLKTVRIYNLLAHGPLYATIAAQETILPLVETVLDRGCLVSSLSSIAIGPGEGAQPIHADDMLIPLPRPHVPLVCNTMWALTDFTADNGATRIIPGSHRDPNNPELGKEYGGTVAAAMPRGSVLVWNGSAWHGGGPNRTGARRVGIAMNYCAGWMRQQENQQLGIPREIARTFSPRLRKLVGYGIYRGLLGHIDKCSPVDLLDGVPPRRILGE
jgi:ectoine hydroxylase-related dioxygenase (phytanoyl-CoA dioxygenase family)